MKKAVATNSGPLWPASAFAPISDCSRPLTVGFSSSGRAERKLRKKPASGPIYSSIFSRGFSVFCSMASL